MPQHWHTSRVCNRKSFWTQSPIRADRQSLGDSCMPLHVVYVITQCLMTSHKWRHDVMWRQMTSRDIKWRHVTSNDVIFQVLVFQYDVFQCITIYEKKLRFFQTGDLERWPWSSNCSEISSRFIPVPNIGSVGLTVQSWECWQTHTHTHTPRAHTHRRTGPILLPRPCRWHRR